MSMRGLVPVLLAVFCAFGLAAPTRPAPVRSWKPGTPSGPGDTAAAPRPVTPKKQIVTYDGVPDTGQFLPDTALLARVDDRLIRVRDYVENYFNSYAEDRPASDAAGRREFLNTMINKEVLGMTALAANRPLTFEDRAVMREYSQRVLSNALYQRAVVDSSPVSEDEIRNVYAQYSYQQHMRHILLRDRATAERVRADLLAKRVSWSDAVRKHSIAADREQDGDMGWAKRIQLDPVLAEQVYALEPGEISTVVSDGDGYHIMQSIERRSTSPPAFEAVRGAVRDQIRGYKMAQRAGALQTMLGDEIGMTTDSTNIAWASSRFPAANSMRQQGPETQIEINADTPEFAPEDTSRVLARHRFGQFSLGRFLEAYLATSPLVRPNVNDFESMRGLVVSMVLEPNMAELAVRRGLDRDPMAVRMIEGRREQMLVEHMYQDSILSKVWVRPAERRKYYAEHRTSFVTLPKVTYVPFWNATRGGADSLAARLRAGEQAQDILRADSARGEARGSIRELVQTEHGAPFYRILFEELRPGQVRVEGPVRDSGFIALQLLTFDVGRQLRFEEVAANIDESLQNIHAEEMLKALLARHKREHAIVAHPELLDRVRLVDPTLE
jgi:parvulin-like peptidyl-prolyl isomerase